MKEKELVEEQQDSLEENSESTRSKMEALIKEAEEELNDEKAQAIKGNLKGKLKELQLAQHVLNKLKKKLEKTKDMEIDELYFDEIEKKKTEENEDWG